MPIVQARIDTHQPNTQTKQTENLRAVLVEPPFEPHQSTRGSLKAARSCQNGRLFYSPPSLPLSALLTFFNIASTMSKSSCSLTTMVEFSPGPLKLIEYSLLEISGCC